MRSILLIGFFCLSLFSKAQVTIEPVFASADDTVTIRFDASQGNGALEDVSPSVVYAHMGLITTSSTSGTDWRYVQGNWGTADAKVRMDYKGNNIYEKRYHIRSFHGLPANDTALKLAFVFRNASGNIVGRASDGTDIFVDLYDASFAAKFITPNNSLFAIGDSVEIQAVASDTASLQLLLDGQDVLSVQDDELRYGFRPTTPGSYVFELKSSGVSHDRIELFFYPAVSAQSAPPSWHPGINYLSDTSVGLKLYAPGKQHIFVLGDFNDWSPTLNHFMKYDTDGHWWVQIDGLEAGTQYAMQYFIDGNLYLEDPYSELILDPYHDQWIDRNAFPDLPDYPEKAQGIATVLQPGQASYNWVHTDFEAPAEEELVVYELLVRDFTDDQNFQGVLDNLDYFERLGVNAIEFMPVSEFEGNNSWGYNVSHHMALDKYYGNSHKFKELIDSLHGRGIAVILDVVFNHAFGQSPLCRLYWDAANFRPSPDNPWLNVTARHPYNVGYDFNHESEPFRIWMDRVIEHWLVEYKVDGYRFDLSKGFTQLNSGTNEALMAAYDAKRIARIKYLHDFLKQRNPDFYVILEHFAENSEEIALTNHGCMIWGNLHYEYKEATMGYGSNFSWADYQTRGWSNPKAVVYMESHDEERIIYDCLNYGNTNGSYMVNQLPTALDRLQASSMMFFAQPGPKMFWMGTELGYDVAINTNGRTGEKPFRWEYYEQADRLAVHRVYAEMAHLKKEWDIFNSRDYDLSVSGTVKRIKLRKSGHEVIALANFGMSTAQGFPYFGHTGWWYEHFSGDSLEVTNTDIAFNLEPGEYMLWSDQPMESRFADLPEELSTNGLRIFPNPSTGVVYIELPNAEVHRYRLLNNNGQLLEEGQLESKHINLTDYAPGSYVLEVFTGQKAYRKLLILR